MTKGSGSNWAQAYDPATNHMLGNPLITYDANGNIIDGNLHQTYDVENRVTTETIDVGSTSHPTWYYDASGKRVVEIETLPDGNKPWTLYAYDIFGKVYATLSGDSYSIGVPTRNVYFGDRLIQSNGTWVVTDRLGSVRANSNGETFSYLPYGEERTATANSRIKFGTYFRDSTTYNQDYADQRYYSPWFGTFNTPDPSTGIVPADPATWNKYSYVSGDPVNFYDPRGLEKCNFDGEEGYQVGCIGLTTIGGPPPSPITDPNLGCATVTSPNDPAWQQCFGPPSPLPPPPIPPENNSTHRTAPPKTPLCLAKFYNSRLGKAVQFGSPLSLLPGWNPQWGANLTDWATALSVKFGGLIGSGAMSGTAEVTTLGGTTSIASALETYFGALLGAIEKAAPVSMATATLTDIVAHDVCTMQANPDIANAAMGGVSP